MNLRASFKVLKLDQQQTFLARWLIRFNTTYLKKQDTEIQVFQNYVLGRNVRRLACRLRGGPRHLIII